MNLKIPKDQAIKILRLRLNELNSFNFNPQAWKNKTENDLRAIFPTGSMQWLQISSIEFDTYIDADKARVYNLGKDTASQLVKSYIEFIEEHVRDTSNPTTTITKAYETNYTSLLAKWNELVKGHNELINKYDEQKNEIVNLKADSVQLSNVSLKKLFKVFSNLPAKQSITLLTSFIAILFGIYKFGGWIQKNIDNIHIIDLKNEKSKLINDTIQLSQSLIEKRNEVDNLNNVIRVLHLKKQYGPAFNQSSQMATLTISNDSQSPCNVGPIDSCWKDSISANAGDTISIQIYYQNSTLLLAENTTLSIQPFKSFPTKRLLFTGGVASLSMNRSVGYATLNLTTPQSVTYIPASAKWYNAPNNATLVKNIDDLFGNAGFNIGTINPGEQGILTAKFAISNNR